MRYFIAGTDIALRIRILLFFCKSWLEQFAVLTVFSKVGYTNKK